MGRTGVSTGDADRWIFNRLAEDYRSRPAYPEPLVDRLSALAGPGGAVVELGAGTGLLAGPLARRGHRVIAVEPAAAMLEVLREASAGLPVEAVQAAAEETGLPAGRAALVVLADVLQWVDPERAGREAGRLLGTGGAVAVVEIHLGGSPFSAGVAALVADANPRARPRPPGRLAQLLAAAGATGRKAEAHRDEVMLDARQLDAVLRSNSMVGPALGPERLTRLLEDARALASRTGGARWTRELTVTWARKA